MSKEYIEQGNHIIALFMGATYSVWKGEDRLGDPYLPDAEYYYFDDAFGGFEIEELQYHSSWDWLMPVVQKINGLSEDYWIIIDSLSVDVNKIKSDSTVEVLIQFEFTLEGVYQAVVECIKLINNEK